MIAVEARRFPAETWVAMLSILGIACHLIVRYGLGVSPVAWKAPLWCVLLIGGAPLVWTLSKRVFHGDFGSDLLAGISIIAAILLGEYLVGAIVVLMLSGGTALEHHATRRASFLLDALARRMPQTAHKRGPASVSDIPLGEIAIGDELVVFPHEICPVDGVVTEGDGIMDESFLTGEPYAIAKAPGSLVLSGAVNGEIALTIRASRLAVDSRYARIMEVTRATAGNRPPMRRLADRLGAWYTPLALTLAVGGWVASGDPLRFLAVLVIATPCPLLIAIPVAIIGAISAAASRGIVIKNPALLEQIGSCDVLIFDKTGTLTHGKPSLTEIVCAPGFRREEVLPAAASIERYSKHPLATAVLEAAEGEGLALQPVKEIAERPGEGLTGAVDGLQVRITGRGRIDSTVELPPIEAGLECIVLLNGRYAALFRFRDEPRRESRSFLDHLRPRHGVKKLILLSGDRETEVRHLARSLGLAHMHSEKSPEEKVAIVRAETSRANTLYVGDGINDAPAMLAATLGIALGQNSDITAEAADAVVLEASLGKVDELIHIGSRMRSIALQSAVGGMVLSGVGMAMAVMGWLPPVAGAVGQELIDLLAVLNAVRAAMASDRLTDF